METILVDNLLFNPKVVEQLSQSVKITKDQNDAAVKWLKFLDDDELEMEEKNYPRFQQYILKDILGYSVDDMDYEQNNIEYQIKNSEQKSVICIEVKGTLTKDLWAPQPGRTLSPSPVDQLWRYMTDITPKYGICTNYRTFILFKYHLGRRKRYTFDFSLIDGQKSKLQEFVYLFSKKYLLKQMTPDTAIEKSYEVEKELKEEFYDLFHNTRMLIINEFQNRGIERNAAVYAAQLFLNRLIFIFFAEDHGFVNKNILYDQIKQTITNENFDAESTIIFDKIQIIFKWFAEGSKENNVFGFNGEMFEIGYWSTMAKFPDLSISEYLLEHGEKHNDHYDVKRLDFLNVYKKIHPIIKNILIMDSYDFQSDLNVNILGHIFEQSITDLENLKENESDERKDFGVYYTPPYVTDYICRNSIIPYLSKSGTAIDTNQLVLEYTKNDEIDKLEQKFKMIKILDPACGSGAFLVQAVDVLLEIHTLIQKYKEWKKMNTLNKNNNGKLKQHKKKSMKELDSFFAEYEYNVIIRDIIENNIYGIDINPVSVKIAKMAMFFKLASKQRKLPNLSKNIISGNTLLTLKTNSGQIPLNWEKQFPEICDVSSNLLGVQPGFDVIIGNPPYVRHERIQDKKNMQLIIKNGLKLDKNFSIPGRSDLSNYFFYHCLNWLKKDGKLGFIISDSWMHFDYGKPTQKVLLDNCSIEIMIKPTYKVFSDADTMTVIIILQKSKNDDNVMKIAKINHGELLTNVLFIEKPQKEIQPGNWNLYFLENSLTPTISMINMDKAGIVKSGIKTGNNDFFVLKSDICKKYNILKQYRKPIISKSINGYVLETDMAESYLFDVPQTKRELIRTEHGQNVLKYIEHGEKNNIQNKSTIKSRKQWYSLKLGEPPAIFLSQIIDKQIKVYENMNNFFALDTFTCFNPSNDAHRHALLAFFASSYFSLFMELNGHSMGGGALKFQVKDYKNSKIPDLNTMSDIDFQKMTNAWLSYRENFDREKLDTVVLTILGFSKAEQIELKNMLIEMINRRTKNLEENLK